VRCGNTYGLKKLSREKGKTSRRVGFDTTALFSQPSGAPQSPRRKAEDIFALTPIEMTSTAIHIHRQKQHCNWPYSPKWLMGTAAGCLRITFGRHPGVSPSESNKTPMLILVGSLTIESS
jgi:hypothetical protein